MTRCFSSTGPGQEAPADRAEDIREVLNYRQAMRDAVKYLERRPVCLDLLKKIHRTLMDGVRGQEKGRGKFRKTQNWIGRPGSMLETAKYVPPDPVTMMEALSDWEKYIHYDERDRLVQLAVIHGQFEIIHPFSDGNGRVGRMILPLVLFGYNMLSSPMFYLSAYLERHRAGATAGLPSSVFFSHRCSSPRIQGLDLNPAAAIVH